MIDIKVLEILRSTSPLYTSGVQSRLLCDYSRDHTMHQVRTSLKKLEREGLIKSTPSEYKVQVQWSIIK